MKLFGFGKKEKRQKAAEPSSASAVEPVTPGKVVELEMVVYGTEDDARCRALRQILDEGGYPYRDERVDEDFSTRAWLQRTTGDDALPKVFIGNTCYGGLEDIQFIIMDGTLDRILRGEAATETERRKQLMETMSEASISQLLLEGESLVIVDRDGVETDTWVERNGISQQVIYEGIPHPLDELNAIVTEIVQQARSGKVSLSWRSQEDL
jgi:glutaredoxin